VPAELAKAVSTRYAFLVELNADERQVAAAREQDLTLALCLVTELPEERHARIGIH
jgi:hypothetical protein